MPTTTHCNSCPSGSHEYTLTEFPGPVSHQVCRPCAQRLCAPGSNVWIDCTSPSYEPVARAA